MLTQNCAHAAALPTLDIAEGALDKLFGIYKQLLPHMGGYLTHAGQLHRGRLEMVLQQLANLELETLEQRAQVSEHCLQTTDNCTRTTTVLMIVVVMIMLQQLITMNLAVVYELS